MSGIHEEKIARINLSTGAIRIEALDPELARSFIGGRGLGAKILCDEESARTDPLSPESKLLFLTGPLTDAASSFGRYMIVTKSPQTGAIACSNPGGIWGTKLKRAGFAALIIEGCAPDWTRIHIDGQKIELLDAGAYVGRMTTETDDALKAIYGAETSVLCIGPAGEEQTLIATIMNDKIRAAGKGGAGAVMGSKRLKAITVKASCADISGSACQRCTVRCAHKTRTEDVNILCNELGLDADAVFPTPSVKKKKGNRSGAMQDLTAVIDSMGGCMFASSMNDIGQYADLLNTVTGFDYTPDELMAIGGSIRRMEHLFEESAIFQKNLSD